ncbi:MAG TPA: T9SS type A sorting domain-containing protein, partial [Bacteroidia bacterium]|nr:T9SS type A sorting domain-containing protein [Bacteroidia bacterium]
SSVNIIVYPNPTSGVIYLQSQVQQTIHVQVVSEQGKVLLQGDYIINANTPASINVASFAGGIYFLKVGGDKSSKVVKIIKQ